MKHNSSIHSTTRLFPLIVCMLLMMSGCIASTRKENTIPDPCIEQENQIESVNNQVLEKNRELSAENRLLEIKLEKQKQLTSQLQLDLLKKHTNVNELLRKNERLVSEFVRNKTRLRNRGNKVETVRLLAEVTAVLDMAKDNLSNGVPADIIKRAEQYLSESQVEIDSDNFAGASYLANQALDLIQSSQLDNKNKEKYGEEKEISFLAHLPMRLLYNSNVREEPSLHAKIKFVKKVASVVTAIGYKGLWVKVKIQEDDYGWIYYSLLSGTGD